MKNQFWLVPLMCLLLNACSSDKVGMTSPDDSGLPKSPTTNGAQSDSQDVSWGQTAYEFNGTKLSVEFTRKIQLGDRRAVEIRVEREEGSKCMVLKATIDAQANHFADEDNQVWLTNKLYPAGEACHVYIRAAGLSEEEEFGFRMANLPALSKFMVLGPIEAFQYAKQVPFAMNFGSATALFSDQNAGILVNVKNFKAYGIAINAELLQDSTADSAVNLLTPSILNIHRVRTGVLDQRYARMQTLIRENYIVPAEKYRDQETMQMRTPSPQKLQEIMDQAINSIPEAIRD